MGVLSCYFDKIANLIARARAPFARQGQRALTRLWVLFEADSSCLCVDTLKTLIDGTRAGGVDSLAEILKRFCELRIQSLEEYKRINNTSACESIINEIKHIKYALEVAAGRRGRAFLKSGPMQKVNQALERAGKIYPEAFKGEGLSLNCAA